MALDIYWTPPVRATVRAVIDRDRSDGDLIRLINLAISETSQVDLGVSKIDAGWYGNAREVILSAPDQETAEQVSISFRLSLEAAGLNVVGMFINVTAYDEDEDEGDN